MKVTAIAQEYGNLGQNPNMRQTTMPYIDVPVAEGLSSEDHQQIVKGAMLLLVSALGKTPNTALVVINKGCLS